MLHPNVCGSNTVRVSQRTRLQFGYPNQKRCNSVGLRQGQVPVRQPTKFELAVNLKSAQALGHDMRPMLFASADEVIK